MRVSNDLFLPLSTDFEERKNYPVDEIISGHRIYVPEYDIASMLKDGENVLALHFGGGWYSYEVEKSMYGKSKAIWRIFGEDEEQAALAGLLHDCAKQIADDQKLLVVLDELRHIITEQ